MTAFKDLVRKGLAFLALAAWTWFPLPQAAVDAAPRPAATVAPTPALPLIAVAPIRDCRDLATVDVSSQVGAPTVVVSSAVIDDGRSAAYCNVKVVIDAYARFELHLPVKGWTQRLLFGGGPGAQADAGIDLSQFATVSWQDLGRRPDEDVLANDYRSQVYAGYKGMHMQVLAAKALLVNFYGRPQRFAYFNACSNPGREGLIEAQRFPKDFDGIGAGCPPLNITLNNGLWHAWNVLTNNPGGKAIITTDKLPILHQAVLDACDAADGATDQIVSEPFSCRVPLEKVECRAEQDPATCLSADQVRVARALYRGPHDAAGHKLAPSGVLPGSELAWTATIVPGGRFGGPQEAWTSTQKALRSHYNLPALDKSWTLDQVSFDLETLRATTRYNFLHDATDTDMAPFARAGGKLILWMALGDTNVLPTSTILYYQMMRQQTGATLTDHFARFYLLPGVYHCGGGDGPILENVLIPLMAWVERGIAPGALPAVHAPGNGSGAPRPDALPAVADLSRPIWPYPYTSHYTREGEMREAASWQRGPARPVSPTLLDWAGIDLYRAGAQKWCTATADGMTCAARP